MWHEIGSGNLINTIRGGYFNYQNYAKEIPIKVTTGRKINWGTKFIWKKDTLRY